MKITKILTERNEIIYQKKRILNEISKISDFSTLPSKRMYYKISIIRTLTNLESAFIYQLIVSCLALVGNLLDFGRILSFSILDLDFTRNR